MLAKVASSASAHRKGVGDHRRQRNDTTLRRFLLAGAVDPARVTPNNLVISSRLEDCVQKPIGLGDGDGPKRAIGSRAAIKPLLPPATHSGLVYVTQQDSAKGWQQMIAEQPLVQLDGAHLEHAIS
jgi:hypothetical protein